jgi:hypothetical protein
VSLYIFWPFIFQHLLLFGGLISSIIQIYDLSRGNFNNIGYRKPIVKPIGARTTLTKTISCTWSDVRKDGTINSVFDKKSDSHYVMLLTPDEIELESFCVIVVVVQNSI